MKISDKWKAVIATIGTLATAISFAVKDGNISIEEGLGIVVAAVAVGGAVFAKSNKAPAAG